MTKKFKRGANYQKAIEEQITKWTINFNAHMENHNNYLKNMKGAWEALENKNLTEREKEVFNNMITKCEEGALIQRRLATKAHDKIKELRGRLK